MVYVESYGISLFETDLCPWTEEHGGLQSMGSQRDRYD